MNSKTIMAFGAHPDDLEMTCGGTLIKLKQQGHRVICCDMTEGELGTRGTIETRKKECAVASKIMGIDARENLSLEDGFISSSKENKFKVIQVIRKYKPDLIMVHYYKDRHPDHYNTSHLVYESTFLAGLSRIDTGQEHHRVAKILYYIGWVEFKPTFIVDITDQFKQKIRSIYAYETQVKSKDPSYPQTRLTSKEHQWKILSRNKHYGSLIGKKYGEPFLLKGYMEVKDVTKLSFLSL
ncbi:MAG TPA: bacillithiol biosynthesis deacetylase BshB1 [Candidatus Eremiobacteraeota bacterium]|nr:MAG: 1D-myo-inositol 2-acetamido-2-deoxy-alpha-D-glucopyranoside deacetylase [bacterium ADurb.Bin363]HPZ06734.1 bacillithiol biosynthesis deacetylase BshB1 [Candidatus Eremiobacteraeota bacterium]